MLQSRQIILILCLYTFVHSFYACINDRCNTCIKSFFYAPFSYIWYHFVLLLGFPLLGQKWLLYKTYFSVRMQVFYQCNDLCGHGRFFYFLMLKYRAVLTAFMYYLIICDSYIYKLYIIHLILFSLCTWQHVAFFIP